MKNLKVLLISSNSSSRGGGEKYLIYLARGLRNKGFNVEILLSSSYYMDTWYKEFKELNFNVKRLKLKGLRDRKFRFFEAIIDFNQIFKISNYCRKINPKFIVVNQQYDEDDLDFIQGSIFSGNKNVISIIHMPMTKKKNHRPLGRFRGFLLNIWYKFFKYKKVLVSYGSRQEFTTYYKSVSNTFLINNAVPQEDKISDVNSPEKKAKKYINLTFIGQFVHQKNLIELINIWSKLRNDALDVRLNLIGDGPLKPKILEMLKLFDSEYWNVSGWVSNFNVSLEDIDIYVMPSKFEGLPLSLLEVASKGIYCVVNPFNGAADVSKHAYWVNVSKSFEKEDFYFLLKDMIIKKTFQKKINNKKLLKFRQYFSLERMSNQIIELVEDE